MASTANEADIAIIGMAGRFPEADDVGELWRNLRDGVNSVRTLSDDELRDLGVDSAALVNPNLVKVLAIPRGFDCFDAGFFGFSHREAEIMDPQHRLLLECAWHALEDAGYGSGTHPVSTAVYAGTSTSTYLLYQLLANPAVLASLDPLHLEVGNSGEYLTTRISHKLNLNGPSYLIQSACSTGLVAVHAACQSLLAEECDMALAGSVSINVSLLRGYIYQEGGIVSPDGRCRTFDAGARGSIVGGGLGMVVLKRLAEALADGDSIRAVIKGSAVNNDGGLKVGYTAPSVEGQAQVIAEALARSGVDATDISFVEAHGSGTALGDPIEVEALTRAFATNKRQFCALGSVKTNIGHLATAAGITGLIKTVLALQHATIPPNLHFERPNPEIDFENSPFYVSTELKAWPANGAPRRAGVSAFGFGGTNAHVVVEETPSLPPSIASARPHQLLLLSAKSAGALETATADLAAHLRDHPELDLADVAHTLQRGRRPFGHRRALVCRDREGAISLLADPASEGVLTGFKEHDVQGIGFLFPGLGDQHLHMASGLYAAEPAFRAEVDRSCELLKRTLGVDLREILYPEQAAARPSTTGPDLRRLLGRSTEPSDEASRRLDRTIYAQPAMFVVEQALARLWMDWGVKPRAMIGYSLGEYTAACVAGVLGLEEALWLVAERARLIEELPAGAMLAVPLSEDELTPRLGQELSLAAVNAAQMCVVAGTESAVAVLEAELTEQGVVSRRLRTTHAFHSRLMEPVAGKLVEAVRRLSLKAPRIPYLSNVTGSWITSREATDPEYWGRHLCEPVRFAAGLGELFGESGRVLLEVGPGQALSTFARQHPAGGGATVIPALGERGGGGDQATLMRAVGRLWLAGVEVDGGRFFRHEKRRRVPLPTYPFERQRYWIDASPQGGAAALIRPAAGEPSELPEAAGAPEPVVASLAGLAEHPRPALRNAYVAPRDAMETMVAAIWRQLLGIDEIGIHDDFFELGGHSFLTTRLVAEMREQAGVDLAIRDLFEKPTVAGFAAVVASEKMRQKDLVVPSAPLPQIVPDPASRHLPFSLTEVQQAYLMGRTDSFALGKVSTHFYTEIDVLGIDLERLTRAFRFLISRHDMLRAVVHDDGRQEILATVPPYEIATLDLRGRSEGEIEAAVEAIRGQMSHQVRPSDVWPLFELRASRFDGDRVRLHFSFDFLIGDAWSLQVLQPELGLAYHHRESEVPPLAISFRDYVLSLAALEEWPAYRRALAYWMDRLPDFPPAPDLTLAKSPSAVGSPRFVRYDDRLEKEETRRLKELAARNGLTPSALLLAAFAEVLTIWSASPRFAINLTLFNRLPLHPEVDRLVGDFTSLTLLAIDNSRPAPFAERARLAQRQLFEDLDHSAVSGVRVLREIARRQGRHAPAMMPVVFTSTLNQTPPGEILESLGVEAKWGYAVSQTPQVWIDHQVNEDPRGLFYSWDVVEELFPAGMIADMFAAYQGLLGRLLSEEEVWQDFRPVQPPARQLALFAEANATAGTVPDGLLHAPFAVQAESSPERVAVIAGDLTLTYGELARRANALARQLRALGARPNTLVAVVMEKGWEQVVGVLGVLASGAAYLPIDPELPRARRFYLLANGGVEIALTQDGLGETLEWPAEVRWLAVPREAPSEDDGRPLPTGHFPVGPRDLAYVIYTSGSTGNPKGVMIDHLGALNTIVDVNERFGVGPADRALAVSSLSFDLSVYDIFGLLAAGGAVIVPEAVKSRDPQHWARLVDEHGVTVWNTVPALMEMLADFGEVTGRGFPSLRLALLSGDWISLRLPERIRQLAPEAAVISLGGATEASIWSILFPIGEVEPGWRSIPYGRPMRNQTFHVLDENLAPRPVGVPGQLHIGGIGLALGYWEDDERTALSFVVDPSTGERLYRTGDLGRYLPDGTIEFLGRVDFQVKVGGFRIELGEIEVALASHPAVREALVLAPAGERGGRRLIAYLVPASDSSPDAAELRAFLGEHLPAYMIPAGFVALEAFPLTDNGKIDRQALPSPQGDRAPAEIVYAAPRGLVEELLAGFFREVLKVDRVGADDDFFDLGGNSLLAAQVTSRLRAGFDVELPLRAIFERPTLGELARFIETQKALGVAAGPPPLPRLAGAPHTDLPLSFSQQRLWFLDQLEPGSPVYNIPAAVELTGRLEVPALEAALAGVVRRHESLRTTFKAVAGEPVQVIAESVHTDFPIVDLRGLPDREREAEVNRRATAEARRPFDLAAGPLLRSTLLRLAEERHLALVTVHHVVSDGWSMEVLVQDLAVLYAAILAGAPSPLPALPVQYADFAAWQRQRLSGELLESELAWWRGQLAGMPPALDLPVDHPRPAVLSGRGEVHRFVLEPAALAGLQDLSRRHGATLFMTLLAGFTALLGRSTGADDLAVGTPVAGRTRVELEPLIGFFVNTLVLRLDLSGDPDVVALLGRARETTLSSFAHQEMPFERLAEELAPERDLSRPPLVQVLFVVQNAPDGPLEVPGLTLRPTAVSTGTAKLELSCSLMETERGLEGTLEFSRDLFEAATIARLAGHFARLMAAAVAAPRTRLSELPLLSPAERGQLLVEWSGEMTAYPREATIHELFAEWAALSPDAVAVVSGEGSLTYGELRREAGRWARRLRAAGVGPEVRVGVCLDRSPARVVATLAVLEAGGAYVPLDPAYPRERLELLVRDSGAEVLVTEERWLHVLPAGPAVVCLDYDEDWAEPLEPFHALPSTSLAYVMYTSGSTGEPKGVAATHRGVVRLVREAGYARFGPDEVMLQIAPYTFDASTPELWGALLNGGCLVMPPPGLLSLAGLGELLRRHGVTTLHLTTGLFNQMVEENLQALAGLRQLLTGGDVMSAAHAGRVAAELPGLRLLNMYGPTENTTFTCGYPISGLAGPSVPLGRPIANTWVYVLDSGLAPVPVGVTGELWVGGDGLARGYLGRPERTAERFLPDPFGREAGGRLYRTGDLVRWKTSGELEYLGRMDTQVKVRGFRVEPGEVEAALAAHPWVRQAVVLAEGERGSDRRLVAYVAGEPAQAPDASELRGFLRERLPEFMLPAAFVLLPTLPLTANEKVDRKALARLSPERTVARSTTVEPRTPAEELLAGIFAAVLKLERVGVEDSFFELGGHSLLATQAVSRIHTVFGVELPVRAVFEAPTVAGLARRLERLGQGSQETVIPRISRQEPLALSFAQQRLWFLDQLQPGTALYNIPVAVELTGRLDPAALTAALAEVVRRHEALRTTFRAAAGEPVQVIAESFTLDLPMIDLRSLPYGQREQEAIRLTADEARRPFDLGGPLLRVALLRLEDERHAALLTLHHIVSDGWSIGVLVRELGELYAASLAGAPSPLPDLAVQYADFAAWQRRHLSGAFLESELSWWRGQLAGMPTALELPTDRPRPSTQRVEGAVQDFAFGGEDLAGLARRHGATLFMTLLAGFAALLQRYTGEADLAVGTPIAGRTRTDVEPLIGLFVNTLVLRVGLAGDPDTTALLARVRETTLAAYAHQEMPFERLVEELAPERDLGRTPLVQVVLALQNAPAGPTELPGLALAASGVPTETAKFELTCTVTETAHGLHGTLEYRRDLFEAATIERLARHFTRLLAEAAADPAQPLSELPLLSPGERQQMLGEWNDTQALFPAAALLHQPFEAAADRAPEAIAAVCDGRELTYGELEARANRLAHLLRGAGVTPGAPVGVWIERSFDMLAAVLGVLKAGCHYVALDEAWPTDRIESILAATGAPAIVAGPGLLAAVQEMAPRLSALSEIFCPARVGPGPSGRLPTSSTADDIAYIIHTSGSTGEPKGIVVQHRPAVNMVDWVNRTFEIGPLDRGLFITSLCFDLSVYDIFGVLAAGGTVHVATREELDDPERLVELLRTGGITLWDSAPAALVQLAPLFPAAPEASSRLRRVLLSGDWIPVTLPDRVRNAFPGADVLALGGATEATVWSNWFPVGTVNPDWPSIPYGRPIANARYHVLDGGFAPCPIGVPGDLYIGGDCLCSGYARRPDLTAAAFLPDPFAGTPGVRLYRTGDRARYQADGNLEFLGRLDQQVKIRGYRIELGEIEVALARDPAVREAVVLVREDETGKRLVACVVPAAVEVSPADLQATLRRTLPEYMVPPAFVLLDELPVTANGKVDRAALARMAEAAAQPTTRFTAPQGPIEEVLAEVWAELLGAGRVGAHDDFFALGGHSLLATQAISRVREAFKVELPLRALFEAPTVAELAARIRLEGSGAPVPPLVPVPRTGEPPLSFAQQRLWFLDRLAPDNAFYNVFGAVRMTGELDVAALRRAFREIVRRHESLRTTFQLAGGQPVQVIAPASDFPLPLVDAGSRAELVRISREEAERPFDLARGPLFRASLVRLEAREHTLLVNLHHIISDGWSMGILFDEIATLYGAFSQGLRSPLPELPIQFADFALWQRDWLQGERLEAELGYWRRQLAGIPETLELPVDHSRPALETFRGDMQAFALPASLVDGLVALSRRGGATLSMTTLAGFEALLCRVSGQEDVPVGMAIANRTRREVESLIGFFVNTLVMRGDLSGAPGFGPLVDRVRETALDAYAHQDLPFERLVAELQPERDLGRNPLIQVMFGYQNYPRAAAEVRGVVISPPEDAQMAAQTAKFDLSLFVFEDGGRLVGSLEYNSDLFEAATARRLMRHFESLLAAAAAQPEVSIALLPLLSAAEIHQLELEWNDTGSAYPVDASLHELFAVQARCTPDAPALLGDKVEISYGELNRRADALARRLCALGVGLESRVGLCLERSPEMVVGILGILKAGGAYVPLDPSYPPERLALLIRDSGAEVLVTVERWLPILAGRQVVCLGGEMEEGGDIELPRVPSTSLAYVMFTSGSTGEPKGVAVTHQGVVRLVRGTGYARFAADEVMLQIAPFTFDASTPELWGALLNGARLVVPRPGLLSLAELERLLSRHGVTTLHLTAGLFNQMVDEAPRAFAGLRQLLTGGDVMSVSHARRVSAELPGVRLLNMYGPTENTTFTCCFPVPGPDALGASVPLGRAIANTTVHLLDAHGQPVPIGVAGELCAGGDGLARGYLGRPDLTAERFVPNPFGGARGEAAGSRLYRTGDLARRFADGRIEFLGRIDQQVKIRGFRIEPGEIESRLGEHPAVLQNVVLAREDAPGDRRLVAYVVQNPAWETSGVRDEQVSQWSELFDGFYRQDAAGSDPTFNIVGWNSSYTDLPLPDSEMEDWLRDTVERITALAPRRALEIGCGTGMILFRIAPRCELYVGTDVSAQAIEYVERQLGRVYGIDRSRVRLLQSSAEQLGGLEADSLDTVIVNSVAQYFPSADYLAEVIARAVELVRPGGAIFLGDLRSLPLQAAFHASLELFQAGDEMPLARLRHKVQVRRQQENELLVDPAFFAAQRRRLPKLGRVEVHPKRGRAHNELTGFRYQVVLRVGEEAVEPEAVSWLDWRQDGLTPALLRRRLEEERPDVLRLRHIPNARVAEAAAAARLLEKMADGTAGDLRRAIAADAARTGAVEPQDLWDLALDLPYEVEMGWASPGADGHFEAVLRRRYPGPVSAVGTLLPEPLESAEPVTNDPLQGRFARRIAPELRAFLKARLPEYMVPSAFVLLDAMPLTPNEKVDRRQLPAPDIARPESGQGLVAPRSPTEARLAEIWRELLGVERVGVDDDFFELGGHSLLATQAVSRVRESFGVELPLRTFFGTATVAAIAEEVEGLRLLNGGSDIQAPLITPVPRTGRLPLSFAQERLWFLDRLDTRTLAYNEAVAFRMDGHLDEFSLRWSLDELLRRHESLRTTFPEVDGQAVQAIQPPAPFEILSVDLRGIPSEARDAQARGLALAQALRPFDLMRGPLVRGLLVRLADTEHAVLFTSHHIVSDGWSTGIFVRELSVLYRARLAGQPSPLPPLSIQYADFAAWQRQWLQGEALERQLGYWRERLAGAAVLDLPADRPRPLLPQAPNGLRFAVIPAGLTRKLRAFSRSHGTTPFMTLLAAFQALLHRYTGQDDVAVGSPIANRNRGELEGLIGFFINMLVLRTDLSGDPGFGELLERVRQTALGAYAHQDLPFEKLVEELRPDRDLRRTPFFQVSFQLLNVPASALELPGLTPRPLDFTARSAKFDLDLALIDGGEQLDGLLDYDADLFDAATMERLLTHLERLLSGALENPGTRLSELPLLTPAEHAQVVEEWNDTRQALPSGMLLHELFEAQVARDPEAVALIFEGEELTYGDLNAWSNQLAHALRRQGVGPGVRVGLSLERSPEMMVGLLGVLKSGGAFVPLDPSYPQDRLDFMSSDARVAVLLIRESLRRDQFAGESTENPEPLGEVDELAYVIYTSGSTGRPKGAMNSHRGICNRLLWLQGVDPLSTEDRVLQKTPFSFDVSVWEFFWPLVTGARLVLAKPGGHQDPDYLVGLIQRAGITTSHFVPSMLQVFLEARGVESCSSLVRVICSGEALTGPLARRFFARFPEGQAPVLYNLYGPTEASVEVTAWRCDSDFQGAAVPIGRPVANTWALVLDAHARPVPIGIPGELYLGGVQLARGYLDRPDLTAEKFVPDPFATGARLYRTGDQVRRLAGGEIVYLGRLDHQVKVRGFRIELGEVEAALTMLPGVREAVVIVHEERLVAYMTGEAEVEELRRELRERLPEYMVPALFVPLAALPLNPSGKVDRKALPAPDRGPAPGFVAPRTPVEEALAEIWRELLRVQQVGVYESFFELGGHSLLAVLLMARIEKRFGRNLPLAALFGAPTLEALAALLSQAAGQPHRSSLVAIQPHGDRAPLFCVHPVGGNVLCYLDLARHLEPGQPFYALQSPDPGDGIPASVEEMAAGYLRELRSVQPEGPYRLGGWSMGGLVAFEMARQLKRDGQEVEMVALIDTPPPPVEPDRSPVADDDLRAWFALDLAGLPEYAGRISLDDLPPSLFATFASNLRAGRAYARQPYAGSVTLFQAEETSAAHGPDVLEGWRRSALGGVEASTLPGDHYSLLRGAAVERLARELTERLAVARQPVG